MTLVLVKEQQTSTTGRANSAVLAGEMMALCPACKAFQTLWFTEGRLTPTRKFSQYGDQVYHDCGSKEPCRLYRTV
jgi:hypothetical protein